MIFLDSKTDKKYLIKEKKNKRKKEKKSDVSQG